MSEMSNISEQILVLDKELADLRFTLAEKTIAREVIEGECKVTVAFDNSLSNERQREAALTSTLKRHRNWSDTKSRIIKIKKDIAHLEADRSVLYRKYESLASYLDAIIVLNKH